MGCLPIDIVHTFVIIKGQGGKMKVKISLYECSQARVMDKNIYCKAGRRLGSRVDGMLNIERLKRGEPLVCASCQNCPDFDRNGEPIKAQDSGWVHVT